MLSLLSGILDVDHNSLSDPLDSPVDDLADLNNPGKNHDTLGKGLADHDDPSKDLGDHDDPGEDLSDLIEPIPSHPPQPRWNSSLSPIL